MAPHPVPARPILRRWLPLAAVCIVLALLAYADQRIKTGPPPGFLPDDAQWIATAPDLPQVWLALAGTGTGRVVAEELAGPIYDLNLAARKATGIRPTASRWRVWFGPSFVGARTARDGGFCVRPGILVRMADPLFGETTADPEVRLFGDFFYAWREGCLIVGTSPAYVRSALDAPPLNAQSLPLNAVSVRHALPPLGEIVFIAEEGIPLTATLPLDLTAAATPLMTLEGWPRPPTAVLAACDGPALRQLFSQAAEAAGLRVWWESLDPEWRAHLIAGWQLEELDSLVTDIDSPVAFALADVDLEETLPVPELVLAWQGAGDTLGSTLGVRLAGLPYEWGSASGWVAPYLYKSLTPAWSKAGDLSILTSREPLMAQLAGEVTPGVGEIGVAALRVDWTQAANLGTALLGKALKLGLLPGEDERSLAVQTQPWLNLLRKAGALQLTATPQDAQLRIEGLLTAGASAQ